MGKVQEAFEYFVNVAGYSAADASAIVGNLIGESNLDPNAVGDNGSSFGIAQWRGDRLTDFRNFAGKSITNSTFQEQLAFVRYELDNKEKSAKEALLGAGTIADKTRAFMKKYERPANDSSFDRRYNAASTIADQNKSWTDKLKDLIKGPSSSEIDAAMGDRSGDVTNMLGLGLDGWLGRGTFIVIGVIFVALAIGAFILKNDTAKEIINSVTPNA